MRRNDELERFRADPLAGQAGDREPVADRRAQAFGVERALAEPGGKAKEAQDPQVVLPDSGVRVADEPHAPGGKVVEAADGIVHQAVRAQRQCVDGEVPPQSVGQEIAAEGDLRMASVRLDVFP